MMLLHTTPAKNNAFTPPFPRWLFFLLVAGTFTGCSKTVAPAPPYKLKQQAAKALSEKDFAQAEALAIQIPSSAAQWQSAQLIAGEAASKTDRLDAALKYYTAAAVDHEDSEDGQLALFSAAEIYLSTGRLIEAEQAYRSVLKWQPNNGVTNSRMALLLAMTGRHWEALDHFFVLIKGGDATYRELSMAADMGRQIRQPDMLENWQQKQPTRRLVQIAVATEAFHDGEPDTRRLLELLAEKYPAELHVQAMLGELLVESTNPKDFTDWHTSLPTTASDSPDIWYVRGLWAQQRSELQIAANCFRHTVNMMPFHRRGFTALGQVLIALGDPQSASVVEHANRMVRITQLVDKVLASEGKNQAATAETVELLEKQGRIWEALAWAVQGRDRFPDTNFYSRFLQTHSHRLNQHPGRIEGHHPAVSLDAANANNALSAADFERFVTDVKKPSATQQKTAPQQSSISFKDTRAISFQYYNADDPQTEGIRTFEQTGGGVGIIDVDLDGAPDIFLPQGTEWETGSSQPTPTGRYVDKIFRNNPIGGFADVTRTALRHDSGFGQGCAVGDFNNDGFPDLYVATTGKNCLYENLGDGTFLNVTETANLADASWTASAVVCDLNADGLPDLFDVNYLAGDDVFERICRKRACSPSVFPGAVDKVLINQGDGSFKGVINATPAAQAKGLGVIVFESQPDRRPTLFIANDQVANFLLESAPAKNSNNLKFVNRATETGLAFNDQGLPMACMGIAMDDFDGNSLPDIFVTNFQEEPNTVYLQDFPGLYRDATNAAGIQAPSYPYTGWGTQALDADLDGFPDIVVANGHVDDGRPYGGDYHQPPQFFRNIGGQFHELTAADVGQWFSGEYLGRGMARVDWNLDGLPDFIVSNMNTPVAVLKNTSTGTGHFFRVKLHATRTARDAIGARVSLQINDKLITRQLLAGHGYMASNERVVEFGIGSSTSIAEATIEWPSGATSRIAAPPIDATVIVVEGLDQATLQQARKMNSIPVTEISAAQ